MINIHGTFPITLNKQNDYEPVLLIVSQQQVLWTPMNKIMNTQWVNLLSSVVNQAVQGYCYLSWLYVISFTAPTV